MSDKILALKYNPVYLYLKEIKMNLTLAFGEWLGLQESLDTDIGQEWGCGDRAADEMSEGRGVSLGAIQHVGGRQMLVEEALWILQS